MFWLRKQINFISKSAPKPKKRIEAKRAVLIFFDTEEALKKFRHSGQCDFTNLEELTPSTKDKDAVIRKSTRSTHVTLVTKAFGRGTDFICHDEIVKRNGGIHVIQTFFCSDIGEEIQIKGRTARQGQEGSFQVILKYEDPQRYGITEEIVDQFRNADKSLYQEMCKLRQTIYEK